MRDILFRGKRLDNGAWVYGSFCMDAREQFNGLCGVDGFIRLYDKAKGKMQSHEVDRETVGQYTGLLDKNGTRIFEGDIVSTDIKRPYLIVEFRDGCFMFNCNDGGEDYYDIMLPIIKDPQTVYKYGEVIGNIHNDPELLEGDASE